MAQFAQYASDCRLQGLPLKIAGLGIEFVLPLLGEHGAFEPGAAGQLVPGHRPFRLGDSRYDKASRRGQGIRALRWVAMLIDQSHKFGG